MAKGKKYQLFISSHCPACDEVVKYFKRKHIDFEEIDIEKEEHNPPKNIFVVPALFSNGQLLAYGGDIIGYLEDLV